MFIGGGADPRFWPEADIEGAERLEVLVKGACLLPSALCAASTKPFIMARKITLQYQANHITAN